MKSIPIPVVALGPGSQPADESASFAALPKLEPLGAPRPPEGAEPADLAAAAALVEALLAPMRLRNCGVGEQPRLQLAGLAPPVLEVLNQCLGQGEVSVVVRRGANAEDARVRIQETGFAGLWRVRHYDAQGRLEHDVLEACDMPQAVRASVLRTCDEVFDPPALPDGLMNAPAVLGEIAQHVAAFDAESPPHVVNLTLLPMSPADLQALDGALGGGPVTILSRGFGNCRIESTAVHNVWRVRYFNNMDTVILDTIEICSIPEVALAAAEDIADSTERLAELVDWMKADAAGAAAVAAPAQSVAR